MMSRLFRWLVFGLGFCAKPRFTVNQTESQKGVGDLDEEVLLVVGDPTHEKWACFHCPGGCGEKIRLNLSASRRPRWRVFVDWLGRPTVSPSIWQQNQCGCHFFIRRGKVQWCDEQE